jgi:hypothetical protein
MPLPPRSPAQSIGPLAALSTSRAAAFTIFFALTRAREAPTEPQLPPRRRRALSPIPFARIPDSGSGRTLEPPRVRSAALVTAPVESRRGTGTSPTRWPKPQPGKGALELARATLRLCAALNAAALKDQGKGAAFTIFFALTRARKQETRRLLTNRPCLGFVSEESHSKRTSTRQQLDCAKTL